MSEKKRERSQKESEKRAIERYDLEGEAVVRLPATDEQEARVVNSKNLSAGGGYFAADSVESLPTGVKVRLELKLTVRSLRQLAGEDGTVPVRIGLDGTIVRTDAEGFAVRFDDVEQFGAG